MKARNIGYWAATGLVAAAFLMGGLGDVVHAPQVVEGMTKLGYPIYFVTILGVWKVLGAIALLVPKFPRLKEWAYAGIAFDLTGAVWSHYASGDAAGKLVTPIVLLAIAAASWALRPQSRVLGQVIEQPVSERPRTVFSPTT